MVRMQRYRKPTIFVDGKQIPLARHLLQKHLGRKLERGELVHHIDHDPFNNNINNLQIVSRAEHKRIHKEIGATTRFTHKYQFNDQEIFGLYKTKSMMQISKEMGCSEITIRRIIRKFIPKSRIKRLSQFNKHGEFNEYIN